MEENNDVTAAWASIRDVIECSGRVDAQVRATLERMLAQRRSMEVTFGYLSALASEVKANCWAIAEEAEHEGPHRMQALLGSYRWDWRPVRSKLARLAAARLPCDPGDVIGPGAAIDETAQLKHGDATASVTPQHAGIPHLQYASSAAGVSPNRGDRGRLNLMPSGLVLKALNTWPNDGEYVAEWGADQGMLLP